MTFPFVSTRSKMSGPMDRNDPLRLAKVTSRNLLLHRTIPSNALFFWPYLLPSLHFVRKESRNHKRGFFENLDRYY
jgi:hypothetical protein